MRSQGGEKGGRSKLFPCLSVIISTSHLTHPRTCCSSHEELQLCIAFPCRQAIQGHHPLQQPHVARLMQGVAEAHGKLHDLQEVGAGGSREGAGAEVREDDAHGRG